MYAASWLAAGPILIARFNIRPEGLERHVVERFHLLPIVLLAIPVAVGLDRLAARVAAWAPRFAAVSPFAWGALAGVALVAAAASSLPHVARAHSREVEAGLANMLASVPDDAIIIGAGDAFHFGTTYLQEVKGMRRDVAIVTPTLAGVPYYRERVRRTTGIAIENVTGDEKLSVQLAAQLLATGRPLFADPLQANIAAQFPLVPHGILFRVLAPGSALPPIDQVFSANKELYARFDLAYPVADGPTVYHHLYARTWRILAEALARAHRPQDAAYAIEMANALSP
jgi:hypothetical protein